MFSIKNRIVIVLFENNELSRQDIADLIHVKPSEVSRCTKSLLNNQLILKKRKYVSRSGRFRDYYSLTQKGIFHAMNIKESLHDISIDIITETGVEKHTISELIERGLSLTYIIGNIRDGKLLDTKSPSVVRFGNIPEVRYFFGRENELKEIREKINDENTKLVVVNGIPGIGKTTLIAKFVKEFSGDVFWYRIKEWDTIHIITRNLAEYLKRKGKTATYSYIKSNGKISLGEISIILERELDDTLFVFDDTHNASDEIVTYLKMIYTITKSKNKLNFIAVGRHVPVFYNRTDVVTGIVYEMELPGLDATTCKKFLKWRNIPENCIEYISSKVKGHPLLIEIVSPEEEKYEIDRYLRDEIYRRLSEEEKEILGICSLLRYPADKELFMRLNINYDVVRGLMEKMLLRYDYTMHDIIREFIYSTLTEKQRLEYHACIGEYYKEKNIFFESCYHFAKANARKIAGELVINHSNAIINDGHIKDFCDLLRTTNWESIHKTKINLIIGNLLEILGEWSEAIKYYDDVIKNADNDLDRAEGYRRIGYLSYKECDFDKSIKFFQMALGLSSCSEDISTEAKANAGIGYTYWRMGNYDNAIRYLTIGLQLARKCNDEKTMADAEIGLGNVYWGKGEWKDAISAHTKALEILKKIDDRYSMAKAYNNLGVVYSECDDFENAITCYEKCIEISDITGNIMQLGYGLSNAADVYITIDNTKKAEEYLNRALDIFTRLDEQEMIAAVYSHYGAIYRKRKIWDKSIDYLKKAMEILHGIDIPHQYALIYYEFALTYREMHDIKNAKIYYEKSIENYKKIGNIEKINKLRKEMEDMIRKV